MTSWELGGRVNAPKSSEFKTRGLTERLCTYIPGTDCGGLGWVEPEYQTAPFVPGIIIIIIMLYKRQHRLTEDRHRRSKSLPEPLYRPLLLSNPVHRPPNLLVRRLPQFLLYTEPCSQPAQSATPTIPWVYPQR